MTNDAEHLCCAAAMIKSDGAGSARTCRNTVQVDLLQVQQADGALQVSRSATHVCAGVFDFAWQPDVASVNATDRTTAAVALADGSCSLLTISKDRVTAAASCQAAQDKSMLLSCGWAVATGKDTVLASTSSGHLCVLQAGGDRLASRDQWAGHDLEAWAFVADAREVWAYMQACMITIHADMTVPSLQVNVCCMLPRVLQACDNTQHADNTA